MLDRHTRRLYPVLEKNFADAAYSGEKLRQGLDGTPWTIQVTTGSDKAKGL